MKDCRVLFMNPSYQPHWSRCEPTGLLYIASFLQSKNIDVRVLDLNVEKMKVEDVIKYISSYKPLSIGISAITRQAERAYQLGRNIKKKFEEINLIYGGVHPTFLPHEPFKKGCADFVIVGEGEITFYELIKSILEHKDLKNVKGIVLKQKGKLIHTERRELLEDLDILPFLNYSLVPLKKYNTNIHLKEYPGQAIHIMSSRGCTGQCYYCCSPALFHGKVRYRSIGNILEEIKEIIDNYEINKIHFHDDNFLIKPKRVIEFCKAVLESDLSFVWICLARADIIAQNPEMLGYMKKAGCVGVEMGVECGDEHVLNVLNRQETKYNIKKANEYLKANGIAPMYLLMSYSLGENIDTPYITAKFYYELRYQKKFDEIPAFKFTYEPDLAGHLARPSPGSVFYRIAKKQGVFLARSWNDHVEEKLNFLPNELINDIPIKNKLFKNLSEFINFFRLYRYNLILYRNQNFYISEPLIQKYFGSIKKFIYSMYVIYNEVDGEKSVKDIAEVLGPDYYVNISKVAPAIAILSIFRIVKAKNLRNIE
jgi:anaerobic magnesium-protoporphyrin IX monomethyl ester cyclase